MNSLCYLPQGKHLDSKKRYSVPRTNRLLGDATTVFGYNEPLVRSADRMAKRIIAS